MDRLKPYGLGDAVTALERNVDSLRQQRDDWKAIAGKLQKEIDEAMDLIRTLQLKKTIDLIKALPIEK